MREAEKPVRCVCGSDGSISDNGKDAFWVQCGASKDCGRVGPACVSPHGAAVAWNTDIHALKSFDTVVKGLETIRETCVQHQKTEDEKFCAECSFVPSKEHRLVGGCPCKHADSVLAAVRMR